MNVLDVNTLKSIVLIDDDEDFLHVMKRRLRSSCLEYSPTGTIDVHAFNDPVEALVHLPAEPICAIIVDYNLASGTGLDWLPKLVMAGLGPVLLLTNQTDVNVTAEAFRAGASDYLSKTDAMTDDKRLGRAIREAVQRFRLQASNVALTRQLKVVNAELEVKNKRLKELTETAHRFVDDVAHDFRTPLTVIQQYASILANSVPSADRQEHLATITEAATDLAEMVDDFLDSSKLRAGVLPVYRREHTVKELFQSLWRMLEVRAKPKEIKVLCAAPEDMPPFFGDLSKVSRIMGNLIFNAVKVSPPGGTLRLWSQLTENGDIQIGVTDEGSGLEPDNLQRIFDRFTQIDPPAESDSKGAGLGLSIVKQLARLNFGHLSVASEHGKGSTFALALPSCDPASFLSAYLAAVKSIDEPGDYRIVKIRPTSASLDSSRLWQLISTYCRPMDLVVEDKANNTVVALGIARNADVWIQRLREELSQPDRLPTDTPHLPVEFKAMGPWPRETEQFMLTKLLFNCFSNSKIAV